METIIGIVLDILIIFIGIYLAFFKSYIGEKGKNLATKQDIGDITSKVETIKYDLKKNYDLDKPALDYSVELDKELIKKVFAFNNAIFEYFQLQKQDSSSLQNLMKTMEDLILFIVEFRVRYKDVHAVQQIIESKNKIYHYGYENDWGEFKNSLQEMIIHVEELMGYFIKPLTKQDYDGKQSS
jgi:flagellar basal body-associated protein FliL